MEKEKLKSRDFVPSQEDSSSLRMLKEIELFNDDLKDNVAKDKLKAEAVKWVKMFKKKMCYRESALLIMFFNLTEDDLK